jgi:hypothetical protein
MQPDDPHVSAPLDRRMLAPGIAFLACGTTFLAVGLATKMTVLVFMAPAFIVLGAVFLARMRRRAGAGQP